MDREDSRNSSEEVLDHYSDNDLGVGRSYECVFCKRGFNTAQALGGHMNIHRKDRARNKPNSTTKQPPRFYPSPSSEIPRFSPQPHLAYFPAAADATNSTLYESTDPGRQQPADPRDWRMRLSLEFAPLDHRRAMDHDKELDLELRLGYDS